MKIAFLTTIAMLAFAANSVLARLAFLHGDIDPLAYTGVRLVAGALVLVALVAIRTRRRLSEPMGSWPAALALLFYAAAFSLAYVQLGAGTGALILFASVQAGMLAWAIFKGDRPKRLEWIGIAVAFLSLVYLVSPGLVAPPLTGAVLMVVAGVSWAVYSLLGRRSQSPLADTAGNFIRCLPVGVLLVIVGASLFRPTAAGLACAAASGAIASGVGYAVWYTVLPMLSRTRAAFVQLSVPSIAAIGGALLIAEVPTPRLVIATIGIVGGIALALMAARQKDTTAVTARDNNAV